MDAQSDLQAQALRIISKHGAGSDEYSNFLAKYAAEGGHLPHGVTVPRYVPGDVRSFKKKKSRKSRGKSFSVQSEPGRAFRRSASSCGSSTFQDQGHTRTISETFFIQGLEPVVITRQESVQEALQPEDQGTAPGDGQAAGNDLKVLEDKLHMERSVSVESTDIREVVDQFKVVLHEKAQVEGSLVKAKQTNEVLKQEFDNLKRQHADMTLVQETMNDQVSRQLQLLLKEKSQLMEQNHQLQAENGNLKVLLDLATEKTQSDDEAWDRENDDYFCSVVHPLQEISAWHPFTAQEMQMGDKHNFIEERVIIPEETVSRKFDRISITT